MTHELAYASPRTRRRLRLSHAIALGLLAAGAVAFGGLATLMAVAAMSGEYEYGWDALLNFAWISLAAVSWTGAFLILIRRNSRRLVRLAQAQLVLAIGFSGYLLFMAMQDPQPDEDVFLLVGAVITVWGWAAAAWLIWRLQWFTVTPTSGEGPGMFGE